MRGRRIGEVVADQRHADGEALQRRIIQRVKVEPVGGAGDEDVAGAVIGLRGEGLLEARRHANHEVAALLLQRVADEAATLRPPGVFDMRAEMTGQRLGDAVLEAGAGGVGIGQVVGVRADPQRRGLLRRSGNRSRQGKRQACESATAERRHRASRPWWSRLAGWRPRSRSRVRQWRRWGRDRPPRSRPTSRRCRREWRHIACRPAPGR